MERLESPIEQHLQEVFMACIAYLQTKHFASDNKTRLADTPQPEALGILYSLRNMGTTYWPGGLANQPCVLLKELNKCIEAEIQSATIIVRQELQEAAARQQSNGT